MMDTPPTLMRAHKALRDAGFKLTTPRLTILELLEASGGHLTSTDLLNLVEQNAPAIGRASVFRTLDLFARLGIVASTVHGGSTISYVLMTGGHHHHMVCTNCQKIIEFEDCRLGTLMQQLHERYGFAHGGHLLEVYGLCYDCELLSRQPVNESALLGN
jgi:Fur family ferric uptake transcriptional regulator